MSFYKDGQRYRSRPPMSAQPSQFQPADYTEVHPLRQHSISQDNSPTIPTKQPMAANPTSYAARAQGGPPLSLDTSPSQQTPQSYTSTSDPSYVHDARNDVSPPTSRHKNRKGSVPERSPLQKLEVTLGDISKEEKRARVEEAERNLKARRAGGTSSSSSIPRKPVNGNERNGQASLVAPRTQRGYVDQGVPVSRKSRRTSLGLDPFPSRDRQYGYDASRTGGAAAAAVGAYQAARHPYLSQQEHDLEDASTPQPSQAYPPPTARVGQPVQSPTEQYQARSTGAMDHSASSKVQAVLGAGSAGALGAGALVGASAAKHLGQAQTGPSEQTPMNETAANHHAVPGTVAGREAREAVGLDSEEAAREEYGGRGGRLKFSQVIHPFSDGTGRRYKESEYLQDWRNAATALLTADDLDLDSAADQQAWWEREKGSKRSSRARNSAASGFTAGAYEDGTGRTAFNPPLSLKCGPLLRYTGMRGDQNNSTAAPRTFWRGTVMIVTEDATSSTEAAPTLRLFAQPADLYQPHVQPSKQPGSEGAHILEDPLAGQWKCGPRGQTLYVRHASQLTPETDLSLVDGEEGLFTSEQDSALAISQQPKLDGEQVGKVKEVKGHKLHHERGLTFWRFHLEVELTSTQCRVAYRINSGPATAFWVPARGQSMNIMFHSCNGFSLSVDTNRFSGPDPLWRDVLNMHQQQPFHVMIGGGDQIYNDAAMRDTHHFQEWLAIQNPEHKYGHPFSEQLQDELEAFFLHRYSMWFSQGLFGMADAQIPMVNVWDDHDIIDGYGSYPHHFMSCPVFTGLGAVAFKYYMLFQHQSLPTEDHTTEPSWIIGPSPGPYINQRSRSVYMSLGHDVALVGFDCRTERMRDEVLSHETYEEILNRLDQEVQRGELKHLIILLGIPIAYPRLTFAENILTSRAMDPIKALARTGIMGDVLNKFDGGIEVLDDLDDHWTAKHHKTERNWLIEDLQDFAAEKSVRITILGGDVHLAAVGQFYSKKKYGIPKDHDPRYIPNIISSAIVNTPPPETMADFLNKRNKVHHLDHMTDEDMIPLFTYDVDGRDRNNHHLFPRRNYCIIRPYAGEADGSPAPSVFDFDDPPPKRRRSFSLTRRRSTSSDGSDRKPNLLRKLSSRVAPPSSYKTPVDGQAPPESPQYPSSVDSRVDGSASSRPASLPGSSTAVASGPPSQRSRSNSFLRRPTIGSDPKAWAKDPSGRHGHIDLTSGLEIMFRCEINQKDPLGRTQPYRLLIPALDYQRDASYHQPRPRRSGVASLLGSIRRTKSDRGPVEGLPYEENEPATPVVAGDQRFTTMVESQQTAELGSATTRETDRAAAAQALSGLGLAHERMPPAQNIQERAAVDNLPRSGPIETGLPAAVPRPRQQDRPRSLSDQSNSPKRAHPDHGLDSPEDRAYWGAQQVRGELPSAEAARDRRQEKGLRRYYASPFGAPTRHDHTSGRSPPLPVTGLAPPLGAVNNRMDLMHGGLAGRPVSHSGGQHNAVNDDRRVVSDPTRHGPTTASKGMANDVPVVRKTHRSAGKDPYAHYLPEAVEAEFQSDGDVSELDGEVPARVGAAAHAGHDGVSEVSSLGEGRHAATRKSRGESFVSANTSTSLAQHRAHDDSPLYSDEDDLDNMSDGQLSYPPGSPPQSPGRRMPGRSNAQPRPLSKVERLTGESASEQRASYASGGGAHEDGDGLVGRPPGQSNYSKAAQMLGTDPHAAMSGPDSPGMGRAQSGATGGRLGGLMRRISDRGDKTRRKLSSNGGVR